MTWCRWLWFTLAACSRCNPDNRISGTKKNVFMQKHPSHIDEGAFFVLEDFQSVLTAHQKRRENCYTKAVNPVHSFSPIRGRHPAWCPPCASATINMYKSIQNYTYLCCDVLHRTPSWFIASAFARASAKLLTFDITLHRLKFPSSDRYILRVSWKWYSLSCFVIC